MSKTTETWLAAGGIAGAALAAYGDCFSNPFVFLDVTAIVDNPTIRHLGAFARVLSPPAAGGVTVGGRPLVNLSLAVNYALGGTNPWGYHALNLAIHILAGLTLMGIARRTLDLLGADRSSLAIAFAAALLWTVHPLQTEAVAYVVQRAESLMGLFFLLTLYCFIRSTAGARGWAVLSVAACLLGMASKEVMVSAPVIVLLYDRTFVSGSFAEAWRRRRRLYTGLAGTWALLAYLALGTGGRGGTAGFGVGVSWWSYLLTQFPAIVHYWRLAVWPSPLVFDYGAEWVRDPGSVAPHAAIVVAATVAAGWALLRPVRSGRGVAALGFAGAWFFAILAPTSLVPGISQTSAEHRMYLALAPIAVVAAWALHSLAGSRRFLAPVVILGLGLGTATARRNLDYRSDLTLWQDTAARRPDNARAHYYLGVALDHAGRAAEAIGEFDAALALNPDYPEACDSKGIALAGQGRLPEAIAQYEAALVKRPGYPEAGFNLGLALAESGRIPEAIARFEETLRLRPDYAEARDNLGNALTRAGRLPEAIGQFQQALRLQPGDPNTHYNYGVALWEAGRIPEAIAQYETALRCRPDYYEAHANLGAALANEGRLAEAIAQFAAAVRLRPDSARAQGNLGRALAAAGRTEEARACFERQTRLESAQSAAHR